MKWQLALILLIGELFFAGFARAAECHPHCGTIEECQRFIEECSQVLRLYQTANLKNKQTLAEFEAQIKRFEAMIAQLEAKIAKLEEELVDRWAALELQRLFLNQRIRRFYMRQRAVNELVLFLTTTKSSNWFRRLFYHQFIARQDRQQIANLAAQIQELREDRVRLQKQKEWLAAKKEEAKKQANFLKGEIAKTEAWLAQLSSRIESLTAIQKRLIELKTGLFTTSVGETPPVDDPCAGPPGASNFCNPPFRPAFAVFSFGAPHRKGLSQYGAFGRAKAGQNYQTILRAYFGDIRLETINPPATIATTVGTLPFEENYLLGIAEMPSVWGEEGGMEALRAQAVAARTFALAWVGWRRSSPTVKKSICVSEACQVYSSAKASNPPATWRQAVESTRGQIIVSNKTGEIISAWYASTAGGYLYPYTTLGHTTPGGWDTACGDASCWPEEAWEKKAHSPWFYKAWYKTRSGKSCGRTHPWLTKEEFLDIVNALLIYHHDQSLGRHLSQLDASSCWGTNIPETWDRARVQQEAARFGGPISQISRVEVSYSSQGQTAKVYFETNRGRLEFSGEEFKQVFNLRAPGAIHLKSRLFNIVQL